MPNAIVLLSSLGFISYATTALAQECQETAEGRVCSVPQPITMGTVVDAGLQRRLGLVTVNGCSGTLLNRYWVLTARHCVTTNGQINGPLLAPSQVGVTANWAPGQIGIASRINDFAVNVATPGRADIVLSYLGTADLGQVDSQRIFSIARIIGGRPGTTRSGVLVVSGRLISTDAVTQYGRGFSTFATGVFGGNPPAVRASGLGVYRSALLAPSLITAAGYTLAMSGSGQVGHGGDSGGPTVVTVHGVGVGIAGVQSTCHPTGYVTNAPMPPNWIWATGISACQYVSTEQFQTEIRNAIRETPGCQIGPACAIPAIVSAAMPTTP